MLLKRVFVDNKLDHVKVIRSSKNQNFTQAFIDEFLEDGILSMGKGKLTIDAKPQDLVYNILATPGFFVCFDNKKMPSPAECVKYIEENFKDLASPDTENPAGYRKDNFYKCELEGEG